MVSGKHKKAPLYKSLQLLRSITRSPALINRSSNIILDNPSKTCIQGLMELKVENINQDNEPSQNSGSTSTAANSSMFPVVKVESAQERGFVIKVFVDRRSCSGLLVFILEAFEELGLDVLHARVSCSLNFHLEAIVLITDNKQRSDKHAQTIEQTIFQAIQRWSQVNPLE